MNKIDSEDLKNTARRCGYTKEDFNILETDTTQWNPNKVVPITGTVLITFIKTGKNKEYRTGMGTKWLIEFENDLKSNFFS